MGSEVWSLQEHTLCCKTRVITSTSLGFTAHRPTTYDARQPYYCVYWWYSMFSVLSTLRTQAICTQTVRSTPCKICTKCRYSGIYCLPPEKSSPELLLGWFPRSCSLYACKLFPITRKKHTCANYGVGYFHSQIMLGKSLTTEKHSRIPVFALYQIYLPKIHTW